VPSLHPGAARATPKQFFYQTFLALPIVVQSVHFILFWHLLPCMPLAFVPSNFTVVKSWSMLFFSNVDKFHYLQLNKNRAASGSFLETLGFKSRASPFERMPSW
jgi:hypothetical protein